MPRNVKEYKRALILDFLGFLLGAFFVLLGVVFAILKY